MDKLMRNKKAIILFIAPALILFTAILFVPVCKAFYYSFCNYKLPGKAKFLGFEDLKLLKNYKQLLTKDATMKIAFRNSIFFMIFSIVTQLICGLFLAALLTNIKK